MKKIALNLFIVCLAGIVHAQNVGVGAASPMEKLDVNGAIKIGSTTQTHAGTIRWNAERSDFEGYNGTEWVSLTSKSNSWGDHENYGIEHESCNLVLNPVNGIYGKYLGWSLTARSVMAYAGAYNAHGPNAQLQAGAVYKFAQDAHGWSMQSNGALFSPSPAAYENFGYDVSANTNQLAVSAPGFNQSRGCVYIFNIDYQNNHNLWSTLTLPDAAQTDLFGHAVDISPQYTVVGAPWKNTNGNFQQGTAAVYRKDTYTSQWVFMQHLAQPDGASGDHFGWDVSVSGIYMAVGAPDKFIGNDQHVGKVYIYKLQGNTWELTDELMPPAPLHRAYFGSSLDLSGDTLCIGSPQNNSTAPGQYGKVHIHYRDNQEFVYAQTLEHPNGEKFDQYGRALCLFNGYLAVGAPGCAVGSLAGAGKTFVYSFDNGAWNPESTLIARNGEFSDDFGTAVAITADALFVGAPEANVGDNTQNGKVFLFLR